MYQVLVVDDEAWACEGITAMVRKSDVGFQVTRTAENGEGALKALREEPIDVVLTDIRMPGMDGLGLVEAMRKQGYHQPVVLITGHNEFEYARRALRLGASDFLLKPLQRLELTAVLGKLAEKLAGSQASLEAQSGDADELFYEEEHRRGRELVRMVRERVKTCFMEELSLAAIAEQAGFNPSYLSRIFKQETGQGFVQYLTKVRMEAAKDMLLDPQRYIVADVARKVGFWDDKHFSKVFKREVGQTPTEYRKT